jgi:hypothetical protein
VKELQKLGVVGDLLEEERRFSDTIFFSFQTKQ